MYIHHMSSQYARTHHLPVADVFSGGRMNGRYPTADYMRR